jgi:hypothetical protein
LALLQEKGGNLPYHWKASMRVRQIRIKLNVLTQQSSPSISPYNWYRLPKIVHQYLPRAPEVI